MSRLTAAEELRKCTAQAIEQRGRAAFEAHDRRALHICLRELECRTTRRAQEAEVLLRGLREKLRRDEPSAHEPEESQQVAQGLMLVSDEDIKQRRLSLVAGAESSLWIGSLTFPNEVLVEALARKTAAGVTVTLISYLRTLK